MCIDEIGITAEYKHAGPIPMKLFISRIFLLLIFSEKWFRINSLKNQLSLNRERQNFTHTEKKICLNMQPHEMKHFLTKIESHLRQNHELCIQNNRKIKELNNEKTYTEKIYWYTPNGMTISEQKNTNKKMFLKCLFLCSFYLYFITFKTKLAIKY